MSTTPIICFGQQPCGFFPRRFLVAKIQTARRLQAEIGGEIVFFYHDSDHDPRETQTILRHRKTREPATLNFAFANKVQRKFSPLYLKRVATGWPEKTELQLPNYVERNAIDCFRQVSNAPTHPAPVPGARLCEPQRSELRGATEDVSDRDQKIGRCGSQTRAPQEPRPAVTVADFCLEMYRAMGLLAGVRVVRSGDGEFRRAACDISEFFVDVPHAGEIVRARYSEGRLRLHEGGEVWRDLPETTFTKEQISPTRDSRLRWMQSVLHCTHYIAGAGERAYLRPEEAPEITFVNRDVIDEPNEAWTELPA
jgi:hypothetical protein